MDAIVGVIVGAITALCVQYLASWSTEKQNEERRRFENQEARRIHRIGRLEQLFIEFREWSSTERGCFALLHTVDNGKLSMEIYLQTVIEEMEAARGDKNMMFMLAKSYGGDFVRLEEAFEVHAKLTVKMQMLEKSYTGESFDVPMDERTKLNQLFTDFNKLSAEIEEEIALKIRTLS